VIKWKKLGRVFNPLDHSGFDYMNTHAQSPSVIVFDDFIRVYINTRPPIDENGYYVSYLSYVDLNKENMFEVKNIPKRPIMSLGKLGTFDEFGIHPSSVIRDGNKFRVYYAGTTRCESVPFNSAIGVGISIDNGDSFEKIGDGPVLSYSFDEPFVIGSPKIKKFNDLWYLFYSAGRKWVKNCDKVEPVYKLRMAVSSNGLDWEKHGKDIIINKLGVHECQASADVFFKNDKYHMFFSYRPHLDYRLGGNGYKIGYASSKDLKNWERDDTKTGITVSKEGWDCEMISYPNLFELKGKTYMFYLGNEFGKYGFGLAELTGDLK